MTSLVLAFAGSSITYTEGPSFGNRSYHNLVTSYCITHYLSRTVSHQVAARSGRNTWNNLVRLQADVMDYVPRFVIFDTANNADEDHSRYAVEALIRRVTTLQPGTPLIALLFPAVSDYTNDATIATPTNATELQNVRDICDHYGVPYVDYAAELADRVLNGGEHLTDYMTDNIHPGEAGHALVYSLLESSLPGLVTGSGVSLVSPLYDLAGDYSQTSLLLNGTAYTSRTGTWTDVGTEADSSEVGATITYSGTFSSIGIEPPDGYDNPAIQYKVDDGAFTASTLTDNGVRLGTRAAHTVVFKVVSGTLKIKRFMAL